MLTCEHILMKTRVQMHIDVSVSTIFVHYLVIGFAHVCRG